MMAALVQTADQLAVMLKDGAGIWVADRLRRSKNVFTGYRCNRLFSTIQGLSPGILDKSGNGYWARVLEEATVMAEQSGDDGHRSKRINPIYFVSTMSRASSGPSGEF